MKSKGLLIGIMGVLTALFVGCNPVKTLIKPIAEKTYSLTTQVESYIVNSTNLVEEVKGIVTPLKTVGVAINFVKEIVTDSAKKENLEKVLLILDQIILIAENVNTEQIDQQKQLLLDKLTQVKAVVITIGEYAGVDFNTLPKFKADLGTILLKTEELTEELVKARNRTDTATTTP